MNPRSRLAAVFIFVGVILLGLGLRAFLARADCGSGGDSGTVAVLGESPVPVRFAVAAGAQYKLMYPANVALWTSPVRTTAIPSDTVLVSGSGPVFGDANGDGQVRQDDLIYIRNRLGTTNSACDLNGNGVVDGNDLVLCRNALGAGPGKVVAYVEGLSVSAAPCDVPIRLLTDPDQDGTFTQAAQTDFTVAEIGISPDAGTLGTPVTISLTPAGAPLTFTSSTTAFWEGYYQPLVGPASSKFSISFSAGQFRETGPGAAVILAGDGTPSSLPALELLSSGGILVGSLAINFGSAVVRKSFTFAPASGSAGFASVIYPDWPHDEDPPYLGEPLNGMRVLTLSDTPDPTHPDLETLLAVKYCHAACVCKIAKSPEAAQAAPATIRVNIISFTSDNVELDRIPNLVLHRSLGDPDPQSILYIDDLSKPIIAVNVALNKASYPEVLLLQVPLTGHTAITPVRD